MENSLNKTTIELPIQEIDGQMIYEEIVVSRLSDNRFRVLLSPGMVEGLAAGDEIELDSNEKSGFRLLRRGGNIAIHFIRESGVDECESAIREFERIGGRLDGRTRQEMVFTISAKVGFPVIDDVIRKLETKIPDALILYGNVYDPKDGVTPLNWWNEEPAN